MIKKRRSQIASWKRWAKKAKWYQKAGRWARYAKEAAWRNADIARRYTTIAAYKASLVVANTALDIAKGALTEMESVLKTFPIDADPRVAGIITAKTAATVALELAKKPFEKVPYIEGDFAGDIELTLDSSGIHGTVSANLNGFSLLEGSLAFEPQFEACLEVPTFGAACTKL